MIEAVRAAPLVGLALGWRLAVSAGAGVIGATSLAPLDVTLAQVLALAVLAGLVATSPTRRVAIWTGWIWAVGYFGHALSWIVEPFFVDVERHGWMAPFAILFLAGGLALFWAFASGLAYAMAANAARRAILLPVTLALVEFGRAYLFTGFPWAAFAQGWVDTPAIQLLAWIGPHGLALLTGMAACWPVAAILERSRGFVVAGFVPLLLLGVAWARPMPPADHPSTGAMVRIVQPNAAQDQKWDPQYQRIFFDRQLAFSTAEPRPDLIVWPETAIPWFLEDAEPAFEIMSDAAGPVPIALGAQRSEGTRYYNSLVHLDAAGRVAAQYDKHHLVPFGEYMPLGNLFARFGINGMAAKSGNGFSAGQGPALISFGDLGRALPLICYEAVFPQDVRSAPERPDFLLQVTNDAWFGTRSGPYQHLAQAQMRAIEMGVPLIRSANTGVSAMIDPYGRVTHAVELGRDGYVDAPMPKALPPTLYFRIGDLPVFLIVLGALAAAFLRQKRKNSV